MGYSKVGEVMPSRRDYVKTANILNSFADEIPARVFEDMVDLFADWFQSDNENFDKARFEKACGVDELGKVPA